MIPCEKCGARGQDPCRTAAGSIARATHVVRIVDEVGELERLTIEAVALAKWIKVTDKPKVEDVLVAAREVDRVVREKAERVAGATAVLFDVPAETPSGKSVAVDGTLMYAADVLGRMLDSLGLSPLGRMTLAIETAEEETDELAEAVALHTVR